MNESYLSKLMPKKRERQLQIASMHARKPSHRNGCGNPYRGKNRAQRQRLSAGFMAMS